MEVVAVVQVAMATGIEVMVIVVDLLVAVGAAEAIWLVLMEAPLEPARLVMAAVGLEAAVAEETVEVARVAAVWAAAASAAEVVEVCQALELAPEAE